jgi:signal transduction histidine kinase
MVFFRSSSPKGYAVALSATAMATALLMALQRTGYHGLSPLMAAVVVSAWYGGLGPSMVSLVLTSVLAYLLLPQREASGLDQVDLLRTAVFAAVALLATSLHVVTRRAREVAERALAAAERSRRAAEEANAAKTRFIAMVSHELRNPLGPVLMAVSTLAAEPAVAGCENAKKELETIRRNVAVQTRMIDDLLDVAKGLHGKLKLMVTRVNLHDPLKIALRSCQDGIQDKRLSLQTEFNAAHTSIYGDAGRLQQVFWNLLRNAIKFCHNEGVISVRTYNDPEGWIAVDIKDNGVGIEPDRLPMIFAAFEQGGEDVTQTFGGLGLGLSICGALIEAHGGTVTASSEGHDKGALFTVRLPLRPATNAVPGSSIIGSSQMLPASH